jgi:hypothetical protein
VKVRFLNIKISLVGYNFALILCLSFDQHWRGTVHYLYFFYVAFRSANLIQSISGFQSTIAGRTYLHYISNKLIGPSYNKEAAFHFTVEDALCMSQGMIQVKTSPVSQD